MKMFIKRFLTHSNANSRSRRAYYFSNFAKGFQTNSKLADNVTNILHSLERHYTTATVNDSNKERHPHTTIPTMSDTTATTNTTANTNTTSSTNINIPPLIGYGLHLAAHKGDLAALEGLVGGLPNERHPIDVVVAKREVGDGDAEGGNNGQEDDDDDPFLKRQPTSTTSTSSSSPPASSPNANATTTAGGGGEGGEFFATVNSRDFDDHTPLHIACIFGHAAMAYRLIQKGADIHAVDENGQTPLHYAARYCKNSCAAVLLLCGADGGRADTANRVTPLHLACTNGNVVIAQMLLGLLELSSTAATAVDDAKEEGSRSTHHHNHNHHDHHHGTNDLLFSFEDAINAALGLDETNDANKTPLLLLLRSIAHYNRESVARYGVRSGDAATVTAADHTCSHHHHSHHHHLHHPPININATTRSGETPLLDACNHQHVAIIKLLLSLLGSSLQTSSQTSSSSAGRLDGVVVDVNARASIGDKLTPLSIVRRWGGDVVADDDVADAMPAANVATNNAASSREAPSSAADAREEVIGLLLARGAV